MSEGYSSDRRSYSGCIIFTISHTHTEDATIKPLLLPNPVSTMVIPLYRLS